MAKILFIGETFENLGLEYLSAVLNDKGHQTSLYINNNFFGGTYFKTSIATKLLSSPYRKLKHFIEKYPPDIIAMTSLTDTFLKTKETANFIKSNFDIPIILGGLHATLVADFITENTDAFDFILTGEGEAAINDLVDFITNNHTKAPDNVWHKNNGQFIKPAKLKPPINLNNVPNPDKMLYYNKFKGYSQEYLIMTSRGCPYSCSFCCADIWQTYYGKDFLRRRAADNVISELKEAKTKYNPKFIWFMDDCFTADKKWLNDFSIKYKNEINLPFFCYSTPKLMTGQTAELLKEAGCHEVAIGVESLNQNILQKINRKQYIEEVDKAINVLKKHNIFVATENIIYLPDETSEDILKAALFYAKTKPDLVLFSYLRLFPKTQLTQKYANENIISETDLMKIYGGEGNSLATGGNTKSNFRSIQPLNLMLLSIFIPYSLMRIIIEYKLYLILVFPPSLLIKIIRILKAFTPLKRKSYDAGLKTGLRLFIHLIKNPISPFKQ